jgi:hypothetical protein
VPIGNRSFSPMEETAAKLAEGYDLELQFDPTGELVGLRNLEAVQVSMNRASNLLLESMRKENGLQDPGFLDGVARVTRQLLSQPEAVRQFALKEPSVYFRPFAWTLPAHRPLRYSEDVSWPFGSQLLSTETTVEAEAYRPGASTVRLSFERKVSPAALKKAIESMASALSGQPRKQPLLDERDVRLSDSGTFVMDQRTGWVREAMLTRKMTILGQNQEDVCTITLLEHQSASSPTSGPTTRPSTSSPSPPEPATRSSASPAPLPTWPARSTSSPRTSARRSCIEGWTGNCEGPEIATRNTKRHKTRGPSAQPYRDQGF